MTGGRKGNGSIVCKVDVFLAAPELCSFFSYMAKLDGVKELFTFFKKFYCITFFVCVDVILFFLQDLLLQIVMDNKTTQIHVHCVF